MNKNNLFNVSFKDRFNELVNDNLLKGFCLTKAFKEAIRIIRDDCDRYGKTYPWCAVKARLA